MFIENENKPLVIFENFFPSDRSFNLLKYLKENIQWSQDIYKFADKEVKSPRMTFFFGNRNYKYSGQMKIGTPFTKPITYLSNLIEEFCNVEKGYFNGCLLNWYRDGKDSITYHSDDEKDMVKNGIIAVLSVGVKREFYLKNLKTNEVEIFSLSNGSLTIMNPICQEKYHHAIMKEPKIKEERISLTFRRFN